MFRACIMPLCLSLCLCFACSQLSAAESVWVKAWIYDTVDNDSYYYIAEIDAKVYAGICQGTSSPKFLQLRNACWFITDDISGEVVGVKRYENENDSDELAISLSSITSIIKQKSDPQSYLKAIKAKKQNKKATDTP